MFRLNREVKSDHNVLFYSLSAVLPTTTPVIPQENFSAQPRRISRRVEGTPPPQSVQQLSAAAVSSPARAVPGATSTPTPNFSKSATHTTEEFKKPHPVGDKHPSAVK